MSIKKIGLFFGSFNPIHVGHLIIANHLVSDADLDEVWLIVSPHNPLKEKKSLANDYDRLCMVELALGDNSKIKASNIEFALPKPSFTIDTLIYLKEKYPNKSFVLLMGGDNLASFDKWKNYEMILQEHEIYVYARPGSEMVVPDKFSEHKIRFINAPMLEISSTYIRDRIKGGNSIRYLVPDAVYKYIHDHRIYQ
ncbi:MAG: nicotinate-nucleotide adenylyltransferase [Saprospiraceae bacterium]|nr:nicotinate-nucleotide adenylyltransferase [Saprospiraceae bacterium]